MNKIFLFLFVLLSHFANAQGYLNEDLTCFQSKFRMSEEALRMSKQTFPGDSNIDVNYYFLNLDIDPDLEYLKGEVQIDFTLLKEGLTSIFLDLSSSFTVDSILFDNSMASFEHANARISIQLPLSLNAPPIRSLKVYYQGNPSSNGESLGLQFTNHGNQESVIWTLSEPYDAPLWWPCVDNPADKADSCDVWISLPNFYTSVSQGVLTELIENENGTNTAKWKHRYPISQYLISIAASNYEVINQYFQPNEIDSMLVVNYLYSEIINNPDLDPLLEGTLDMLAVFSEKYGEYPFIKEKYGHAMIGFGGGMEHQTISSMGGFSFGLISHELAHQWFGDKVTCKTWRDIWVNEGFAEFSAMYYFEHAFGKEAYKERVENHMLGAKGAVGSIAIQNTNSVGAIFDYPLTYQKGSIVLHMLRGVLGDEIFFNVLKEYQNTEFAYGAATIEDFQMIAERVSGEELDYFFEEWIFGSGYPSYIYQWQQLDDNSLIIDISHSGTQETETFSMPMEIKLIYADGSEETRVIFVDENEMSIQLNDLPKLLSSIVIDPHNLILKDIVEIPASGILATQESLNTLVLFPNPVNEIISFYIDEEETLKTFIYDNLGRKIKVESFIAPNAIDVRNLSPGKYYLGIKTKDKFYLKSFLKQ